MQMNRDHAMTALKAFGKAFNAGDAVRVVTSGQRDGTEHESYLGAWARSVTETGFEACVRSHRREHERTLDSRAHERERGAGGRERRAHERERGSGG